MGTDTMNIPIAWMVWRDTAYESREYSHTETAARENASLGVVDSHVKPLYAHPSASHAALLSALEACLTCEFPVTDKAVIAQAEAALALACGEAK